MTLRAINAYELGEHRQMVRAGGAADPGGEGAEMRGVPDIVDPQQRRQGKLAQGMPAIGQVGEPRRQREPRPASRRAEGIDQPRLSQLAIGRLPASQTPPRPTLLGRLSWSSVNALEVSFSPGVYWMSLPCKRRGEDHLSGHG